MEQGSRFWKVADKSVCRWFRCRNMAVHRASTPTRARNVTANCAAASYSCSRFGEDAFVVGLVDGDDVVGAEFFLGVNAGHLTHFAAAV